jgi:hypothetical protein
MMGGLQQQILLHVGEESSQECGEQLRNNVVSQKPIRIPLRKRSAPDVF